ncbi:MAG: M28 family peptidase [Caulobacterales bacterium]|nr:M28 family peptidase [Caulobacterales bacterium]
MKKLLLAALVAALPLAAVAAGSTDPVVNAANLATDIKVLASDAFEGRGPATPGGDKTVAWIIGRMIEAGLQPGGDLKDGKRAWTQGVPLGRFEIKGPVASNFSVGGQSITLNQGEQIAIRASLTNADSVNLAGVPVVFAGYGVDAPERKWNDFAGMDVKGKIVIVLINDPDFESGKGDFGGKAMTYYGRWTYKYEEAARRGAAGLIIVHETKPASYGWATVKNSNTNVMFDIVRERPTETHPSLEAWIQRDVASDLFRRAGLDFDALKAKAAKRGFKAVTLPGVTFSASYNVDHQVIVSQNVVGVLPGKTRPDEHVVYSAHWDHLGVGLPDARGDRIYNGAVDNATGIAALLEIARLYAAGPQPDRSVLFLAVTAEEKGLLGSEYYAANPLYPLATTVADLNMDGFSPTGPARDYTTSGDGKVSLQDDLVAALRARGRTFTPDPVPEAGHFFRSDHFPFAKRGVPAISVGPGEDLVTGGVSAGKAYSEMYINDRYHQPADEWSDDWDLSGMSTDIALLYSLGFDLATSTRWPEWQAGSEFKAIRDASASARQ